MIPRVYAQKGKRVRLEGVAYDFGKCIKAVEFTLDGGQNWTRYDTPDMTDYQNVCWSFEWIPPKRGFYVMHIRSVNDKDECSPATAHVEIEVE
ncbi:Uncharacterised protein [Slackia heliotrinireducens]|uniref:hypothetical protein n=1 Tax=Slackia heliotrinireducens TaxID=84110 RepID=UPI0002D5C2AB|nr:hypothetical protein [Slackia heliotrinireducens]VEG98812.1 Uncharacterised protein [Slackia heliotrinireducens]